MYKLDSSGSVPPRSSERFRDSLMRHLDYPDIGRVVFGKVGAAVVKIFLFFTQCGFCINYHIFLGNTLYDILYSSSQSPNNTAVTDVPLLDPTHGYDTSTVALRNWTSGADLQSVEKTSSSWKPSLELLVLYPLPLFLVFVLLRKVRNMAPINMTANSAAFIAYFLIMGYIISGEHSL